MEGRSSARVIARSGVSHTHRCGTLACATIGTPCRGVCTRSIPGSGVRRTSGRRGMCKSLPVRCRAGSTQRPPSRRLLRTRRGLQARPPAYLYSHHIIRRFQPNRFRARRSPAHATRPDRHDQACCVAVWRHQLRLVKAGPDARHERGRKPNEPGVLVIIRRARLATGRQQETLLSHPRTCALVDHVGQHRLMPRCRQNRSSSTASMARSMCGKIWARSTRVRRSRKMLNTGRDRMS